jgi:hypothetical protein
MCPGELVKGNRRFAVVFLSRIDPDQIEEGILVLWLVVPDILQLCLGSVESV